MGYPSPESPNFLRREVRLLTKRVLILAASVFSAGTFGESVGDFSPLEVGNKWVYESTRKEMDSGSEIDSLSRTTVIVEAKTNPNDTTVYSVSVSDSMFRVIHRGGYASPGAPSETLTVSIVRKTVAQVKEIKDTILSNAPDLRCFVCQMFPSRAYDASGLNDTILGSVPHRVKYLERHEFSNTYKRVMIDDVGLVSLGYYFVTQGYAHQMFYDLAEFNGEPVIAIGISARYAGRSIGRRDQPFMGGYDLLGRHFARPGADVPSGSRAASALPGAR